MGGHRSGWTGRGRTLAVATAGAIVATGVLAATPAGAAPLLVTTTADSGAGSLREAIEQANASPGPDEITIDVTGTVELTSGPLLSIDDLTIHGGGATIAGDGESGSVVVSASGSLALDDVTLTGGAAQHGGGVLSCEGPLVLTGVTIVGNEAQVGGGVFASGALTVENSTIGAPVMPLESPANIGQQAGGGIAVGYPLGFDGPVGECAPEADADAVAAASMTDAPVRIVDSTIIGNGATQMGGGLLVGYDVSSVSVERTLIAQNLAFGLGGGLAVEPGQGQVVSLENSTVSSNLSFFGGGGIAVVPSEFGGGPESTAKQDGPYSPLTIRHSTVTANYAAEGASGVYNGFDGVEVFAASTAAAVPDGPGDVLLDHAIVSGSAAPALPGDGEPGEGGEIPQPAPDIAGPRIHARHSVLGTGAESVIPLPDDGTAGNVLATDPQLGPLTDNGGPTSTHLPSGSSPAVNAGDPAFDGVPATDQRGAPRPQGIVDIGAVELTTSAPGGTGVQPLALGLCDPAPEDGFVDVPAANVHEANIDCIASLGVTTGGPGGRPANEYGPDLDVSRAQLASFVVRVLDLTGVAVPAAPVDAFDDDDSSAHELAINQLAALGVVSGTGGSAFAPSEPVRRDQMATFVANAYRVANGGVGLPAGPDAFGDDAGNIHAGDIDALAQAGIVVGTGPGTYSPAATVHRDQMATFLTNLIHRLDTDGLLQA